LYLTLREKHRLRVFINSVLRKIFGAKRDEVTRRWRRLHNEELYTLFSSSNIIPAFKSKSMRCGTYGGEVRCMQAFGGEM
jgi:hypothetical protein